MRRGWQAFAVAVGAGIVSAPVGWVVTDHLEQDNEFCNACHVEEAVPLHIDIRRAFDSVPAPTLAAAHAVAGNEDREDGAFRCIDCHGGVSFAGRARVKALAAKDTFWYVVGHFEEPDGMRWPLWDEDCVQCHAEFDETESAPWETPRFHELSVHNVELGVDCVECHLTHGTDGDPENQFLHATLVRSQCARCHSEFEEGLE